MASHGMAAHSVALHGIARHSVASYGITTWHHRGGYTEPQGTTRRHAEVSHYAARRTTLRSTHYMACVAWHYKDCVDR
eukprot:11206006-Lingulodinium_polyedra.AAC.1